MYTETAVDHSAQDIETHSGVIEENGILFWALLVASCLIFVFASVDQYKATPLTLYLNELFISGRSELKNYISVFDVVVLIFSLVVLSKYGVSYRSARTILKVIFLSAVVCWLLNMLNPNDRSRVNFGGLPLISEFAAYPFLVFMFTVFFMEAKGFTVLSRRLFLVLSWCFVLRAVILLILWARGDGNRSFFGINSTLTEGDSLLIFAFFQSVFFALILLKRSPAALMAWLLTLAIQVLSYRRSALFVAVIANVGTLALHIFFSPNGKNRLLGVVAVFLIVLMGYATTTFLVSPDIIDEYSSRYLGIFDDSAASPRAGDSGHFQQTWTTLRYAVQKMDFWGFGYGDPSRINIPGAYSRLHVHNVYAAAWLYHGIYMFLFYSMLLVTGIISFIVLLVKRFRHDSAYVLLTGTVLLYFVSLTIVWFFNPIAMAASLRMRLLWVFVIAFVFKISSRNCRELFSSDLDINADE